MNISLVIFCHNEGGNIEKVVQSCIRVAGKIAESYEVIVVDDGSSDNTKELLGQFSGIKVVCHETNMGIGMALRSGYTSATKEFVCAIPGDGQFDVEELLAIKPFEGNVFYSFYRPVTNYTPYRSMLSVFNRVFNQLFLGIQLKDVNWIKVYRKDQLQFACPMSVSSIIESEITSKLMKYGCTPIEIPSVYHPRLHGAPKGGNWKTLRKVIAELLSVYILVRKFSPSRNL